MFDNLKKRLYFLKMYLLFYKGLGEGKVVPFDDEFYKKMSNTFFSCISVSIHTRYLKPMVPPGQCYDRSLYMFFCFDNALLVRGDCKNLELKYGKESAGHGWIEIDNYVYDPSLMMRFDRDLYYKIYSPTNIYKVTKDEFNEVSNDYYDDIRKTTIEDFQIGGRKRTDLCAIIPLVQGIAECSGDDNFKKELSEYLNLIQYDAKQIFDEVAIKTMKYTN